MRIITYPIQNGVEPLPILEGNAEPNFVVGGKTFYSNSYEKQEGTMTNNGDVSGDITTKNDIINVPAGFCENSSIQISPDEQSKIIPSNIKQGITILGELGTYSGETINPLQTLIDGRTGYECFYLLYGYKGTDLSFLNGLDTSNATNMSNMFSNCSNLTTIPLLDTSNATSMSNMFRDCNNLESVPALNVTGVSNLSGAFRDCRSLTRIQMYNIRASLDIHWSTLLDRTALLEIINNLSTVTSATLTLGATLYAKLTPADISIATDKGWTVTG